MLFLVGKIMKTGKVAVVLRGRYAGRKAVVIKTFEEGTGLRKFGHAIGKCFSFVLMWSIVFGFLWLYVSV